MPGVYLSYPFCAQKCTYCNFASGVAKPESQQRYDAMLLAEVKEHRWLWQPETIYWGGGTPSLMRLDAFCAVMRAIPQTGIAEATLECAPGTVTVEKAEAWRLSGINRVSFGVQSFVAEEARRTGRKHTAETVRSDSKLLADVGITNVNLDLISGLPGQTRASWEASLDWIEQLAPPHVSIYLFEMDEDSNLGREALLGGVRYGAALLPTDDAMAEFYERAVCRLQCMGLRRYEISNFARPGYESRHNLKYWLLEPYKGFGVDAHSFDGSFRSANTDDVSGYVAELEKGNLPCVGREPVDKEEEHFFVGLRLADGIRPTTQEWTRFCEPIERAIDSGLIAHDDGRLHLSDRGYLLSNEVFQEFVHA